MKRRHKELMQEVAAAKPDLSARTDSWVESGRSAALLDEILAKTEETTEPEPSQTHRMGAKPRGRAGGRHWTLIATAAFVLVGLAAFVAFYLVPLIGGQDQTALQPEGTTIPGGTVGTTATTAPDITPAAVTKAEALEELLQFAAEHPEFLAGRPVFLGEDDADVLSSAAAIGLIREAEIGSKDLGRSVTRKEFAVWLARGWSLRSVGSAAHTSVKDLAALTAEEQLAVETLISLGVMRVDEQNRFRGDDDLTAAEKTATLEALTLLLAR